MVNFTVSSVKEDGCGQFYFSDVTPLNSPRCIASPDRFVLDFSNGWIIPLAPKLQHQ